MTWRISSIDRDKGYAMFFDKENGTGVGCELWVIPDELEVGDVVHIQWDTGNWDNEGWGQTVRRVDWNDETLVNMSDEYRDMRNKIDLYNIKMRNERDAFINYDDRMERLSNLPDLLRNRLQGFLSDDPDFERESMGFAYELFLSEQACELYKASKTEEFRSETAAATGRNCDDPIDAINAWWALNSAAFDYNYELQYAIMPAWSNGHSGMTASAAKMFAIMLLEEERATSPS